jgi:hypothetical protein
VVIAAQEAGLRLELLDELSQHLFARWAAVDAVASINLSATAATRLRGTVASRWRDA